MEGRRRLKRKSDEDQMSERESRQSSVRARISRDREQQDETAPATTNHSPLERKRFSFPGKTRGSCQEAPDNYQQPLLFTSGQRTKPQTGTTDFEAHLQEVWSVRRNIHHRQQQPSPATGNTGSKTSILQSSGAGTGGGGGGISLTQTDKYSRHGVLPPPEPTLHRNRDTGKDPSTAIETVTPWSLRKPSTNFNSKYSDPRHQPHSSLRHPPPAVDMTSSPPAAAAAATSRVKGRGRGGEPARICREDFEPAVTHKRDQTDKVDYAKSMARGYLRSVGSGEYTPQQQTYVKTSEPEPPTERGKATKWKRTDSDEFDF